MKGDSINHCLMHNLFIHKCVFGELTSQLAHLDVDSVSSDDSRKCVLFALFAAVLHLLQHMRRLMNHYNVYEVDEFDWNYGFSLTINMEDAQFAAVQKVAKTYLQRNNQSLLLHQLLFLESFTAVFSVWSSSAKDKVLLAKQALSSFLASLSTLVCSFIPLHS